MRVICPLTPIGTFTYRAELDAGLTEHEFVHVFRGRYDGVIAPDPVECDGYSWTSPDVIRSRSRPSLSASVRGSRNTSKRMADRATGLKSSSTRT